MDEFDLFSVPADESEPKPTGSLARVKHFGDLARQGRLEALEALRLAELEVDAYVSRQAAVRDAEVRATGEGKVSANPRDTSAKAAQNVAPRVGTQRAKVLIDICEHGGATDYEIEHRLGMLASSVRPRRGELVEGGFVVDSGRVRRHQASDWVIWTATESGTAWYRDHIRQIGA